jgi:fructose-bisphosphate aldolase, class II
MPSVPTHQLVATASAARRGVAAFNVVTLEHAEAIVVGAERVGLPVILQVSHNAVRFHRGRLGPLAAAIGRVAADAQVDVGLHLDHIESLGLLRQGPEHGFSSVMFDASALPYEQNIEATRIASAFAHNHGLWLESELGTVGGKDGSAPLPPHAPGARTNPREAASYVAATGTDALAVAVGSAHAMTTRDAILDYELIAALRDAVPVPLVLHGSSGVPDAQLRAAVGLGIAKVNIGTALNVAFTSAVREVLGFDATVVDPRKYLAPARDAMADTVAHFLAVLATVSDTTVP